MIIFINGTINSGKSTIAKIISEKIPNTANLEIDTLRNFITCMNLEKSIPINLENAVLIAKNFIKHNLHVIIPYPISQKNYEYLLNKLGKISDLYFITLAPNINKILTSKRILNDFEKIRIKHHIDIGLTRPSFGKIIDNTNQTSKETAGEIINFIKLKSKNNIL